MIKRLIDISIAIVGIVLFLPFIPVIIAITFLISRRPILLKLPRVGKHEKDFLLYRFNYPSNKYPFRIASQPECKSSTLIFIQKLIQFTSISGWPQLFNVIKGELSIVGPVPESKAFIKYYNDVQKGVLKERPGIIGAYYFFENIYELSQKGIDLNIKKKYIQHVLPLKLEKELKYVRDRRILKDIILVLKSIRARVRKIYLAEITNKLQSYNLFVAIDLILISFSYFVAFNLRYDWNVTSEDYQTFLITIPIVMIFRIFVLNRFGMYKSIWKYVGTRDLLKIIKAAVVSTILIGTSLFFLGISGFPRSVLLIDLILCILLIGGFRLLLRMASENGDGGFQNKSGENVLIIGAGNVGEMLLRELERTHGNKYNVIGFIDDNKEKHGMTVHGIKVLGGRQNIPEVANLFHVDEILIAISNISPYEIKSIIRYCRNANVRHRIVPAVSDILDGRMLLSKSREIEISDLFGRKPIKLNISAISSSIRGKSILITGAGGSIGSELCRQIAEYEPKFLVLVDKNENYLHDVRSEIQDSHRNLTIYSCLSDITDKEKQNVIFSNYKPEIIFHAAAQKHVPLSEEHPDETIRSNIYGTKIVADLAVVYGATHFVLISTDKAVNPASVMGVTKRIAELYIQALDKEKDANFICVRFGNVFNSNGSVLPAFIKQIEKGGPITVTHPDIERYFMSINEAVQLILQSITMVSNGQIFLLDMGKSIKIVDLAKELIYHMGAKPFVDIKIKYIGLRPGEKLSEELINHHETEDSTFHSYIKVLKSKQLYTVSCLDQHISQLLIFAKKLQYRELIKKLKKIVPEYTHSEDNRIHFLKYSMSDAKKVMETG